MKRSIVIAALVTATAAGAQPRDFSGVEIKASKVAGNVYVLEGAGGNIGVSIGEDGIVIVDDQFAPLAPKIQAALKQLSDKPLRFVLNTHFHGDHTGGNEAFSKLAPILAHTNVRKRLAAPPARGEPRTPTPVSALPVVTFDESLSVHLNGEEIRALHLPSGHTDGDSVIFFTGSKVLHMGDGFFAGRLPFIDLRSGGSVKGYLANVKRVLEDLPVEFKIIPGHGPVSGRAELQAFADMLEQTIAIVEKGIKQKKSAEQLKKEKALAKWEGWASQFITTDFYLDTLYTDLSKQQ